jgi:hypothetical protein
LVFETIWCIVRGCLPHSLRRAQRQYLAVEGKLAKSLQRLRAHTNTTQALTVHTSLFSLTYGGMRQRRRESHHSQSFSLPPPPSIMQFYTGTRHASSYGHPPELARRAALAAPLQDVRSASPLVLPLPSRSALVAVLYILSFMLYTTIYLPYKITQARGG